MSLDPTGQGRRRWAMRWKPALNALEMTFEVRHSAGAWIVTQPPLHRSFDGPASFLAAFCDRRGYVRTRITADRIEADFRAVDQVSRPGAPIRTVRSFVLEPDHPGLITP